MQTFANTGIKTEVIDEIISFAKKHDTLCDSFWIQSEGRLQEDERY